MEEDFTPEPDGLLGDDDTGTMRAWFVFSALGFFPATPGLAEYRIGSPLFEWMTLHLSETHFGGNTFVVEAPGNSKDAVFYWRTPSQWQSFGQTSSIPWVDCPWRHVTPRDDGSAALGITPRGLVDSLYQPFASTRIFYVCLSPSSTWAPQSVKIFYVCASKFVVFVTPSKTNLIRLNN